MNVRLLTIDEVFDFIKQGKAMDVYVVYKYDILKGFVSDANLKRLDYTDIRVLNEFYKYLFLSFKEEENENEFKVG